MLKVENLRRTFVVDGRQVPAVRGVSFNIDKGKVYTLLGPSGCGKTTILRCVAGLEKADEGRIDIGGQVVLSVSERVSVPAYKRNVGMVFQSYAIWPHMNVYENVAFGLEHRRGKRSRAETRQRVKEALDLVHMGDLMERPVTLLSGGQQQRVALARALVYQPDVLLLDEPLSNLDARLRDEVRREIKELVKALGLTILYVTHDQVEALSLSDCIGVMRDGVIIQEGSPREIYELPRHMFVARFVGTANQIKGKVLKKVEGGERCLVETALRTFEGTTGAGLSEGDEVVISVRPDAIKMYHDKPAADTNLIEAEVVLQTFVGAYTEVLLLSGGTHFDVKLVSAVNLEDGQKVYLFLPPEACHVHRQESAAQAEVGKESIAR